MEDFIEALNILAPYYKDGLKAKYFMEAEHDCIYFHLGSDQIPEKSKNGRKLIELGLHLDENLDVWAKFV